MKYYLESNIPNCEYKVETKEYCVSIDDAIYYIDGIVDDYVRDLFYSDNEPTVLMGSFDEFLLEEELYSNAMRHIQGVASDLFFISYKQSETSDQKIERIDISVYEYICQRVKEMREDSSFESIVGGVVESQLLDYVDHSIWRIGLRNTLGEELEIQKGSFDYKPTKEGNWLINNKCYYPAVWFGPSNNPSIPEWRISKETEGNAFSFWFFTDTWEIIKYLGKNASDVFLIWYTAECGYSAPDIEGIRNKCPIHIKKEDTVDTFLRKVNQYIIDNLI